MPSHPMVCDAIRSGSLVVSGVCQKPRKETGTATMRDDGRVTPRRIHMQT